MLTITMSVEFEELNDATIRAVAAMLVFPVEVDAITFQFDNETETFQLRFTFAMNGNSATSVVSFKRGTSVGVANLLDSIPHATFLRGTEFLQVWAFGGFEAEMTGALKRPVTLEFTNPTALAVGDSSELA